MKREMTLHEKKSIEKGILDYIDSVCKKNDIEYSLAFGTLLGAVRHKGFIPWDDDIDLCLLREEYDKLISVLIADAHPRYKVVYPGLSGYYYSFAKVVDTYTLVEEKNVEKSDYMGLWVDLFPLDGVKKTNSFFVKYVRFLDKCRAASVNLSFPRDKYSSYFYIPWRVCRLIGYKFFMNLVVRLSKKYSIQKCDLVDCICETGSVSVPKQLYNNLQQVEFEGHLYPAPQDYHTYLTLSYGDYMKLPPEDQRIAHDMKAFLIESK